jgi:hypothetical protein
MTSDKKHDEKTTVVINLEDLIEQKEKHDQYLKQTVEDLEFALPETIPVSSHEPSESLEVRVILFDFESDLFHLSFGEFPAGYNYHLIRELSELNQILNAKIPQILVFHYSSNPKVVNQLSSQVRKKFPQVRTLMVANKISPEKAKLHAESVAGADGYFQLPLDGERFTKELERILNMMKKDNT